MLGAGKTVMVIWRVAFCAATLTWAAPSALHAENVNEFNFPEVRNLSHQASSRLLAAVGATFRALAEAELGNKGGADGMRREALSMLQNALKDFQQIKNQMKPHKLDLAKAAPINNVKVDVIFRRRGYEVPTDTAQLADIALREIGAYIKAVSALDFSGQGKGRSAVYRLNDELHRMMALGIAISQLADTAS
jgi:hypothetical protein